MSARDTPTAAAPTFSGRAVFLMLLAGLVGFVGLGVLGVYAPMLQGGFQGGANALSRSAVGYAGVVRVLRESGYPARVTHGQDTERDDADGLLVLAPPPEVNARDLVRRVYQTHRLVLLVLPKWNVAPDPHHQGWVINAGLLPTADVVKPLRDLNLEPSDGDQAVSRRAGSASSTLSWTGDFLLSKTLSVAHVEALQSAAPANAAVLLQDHQGRPLLSRLGGRIFVLSEPDLLDNRALGTGDGAHAAVDLIDAIRPATGPILFDVSLNGYGRPRSLLALALAPPFLGASFCVLAAALLMGAHALVRFGPARPQGRALPLGKQALLDNSAQLIALARREPRMGRRYAALVRRRLATRALSSSTATDAAPERLDPAIDRLTPLAEPSFASLVNAAETAWDVHSLMGAVRALHRRQTEILGEHR